MKNIHYFGIRHHGVGSTKRLLSALDALKPTTVLIEGASDCSELLPLLAHAQMRPPVALLAYASELPECHFYYPFAEFSPEYQAVLWAVKHGAKVAFIDLPVSITLSYEMLRFQALQEQEIASTSSDDALDEADKPKTEPSQTEADEPKNQDDKMARLRFDPIGVMGRLSGYDDGESFWNDVIEQSADGDVAVFHAIHEMMRALRQKVLDEGVTDEEDARDLLREAFMRQEIRAYVKEMGDGECMAVVCGAWHVPALDDDFALNDKGKPISHSIKSDTALLKQLPKKLPASKVKTTWIPYTMPRLARMGQGVGYGAGVEAPMWYQHLWEHGSRVHEHWLTSIANALRRQGQVVSSASVIEAVRLAQSLTLVRGRRVVGFLELSEAVVACLCFGERLLWQSLSDEVLLGKTVGQIPDDLPLAPLLEDLERLKKQTKLKAEAVPKEIDVDLRSEIGLKKSHLLHRLAILGVPWGEMRHTGSSRGTFRERWEICWEPQFAVALIENLVYGNTIFEASTNCLNELMAKTDELYELVKQTQKALEAGLDGSAMTGIRRLSEQATQTDNVMTLLASLSPLIHLHRYGTARKVALDKVAGLIDELTVKVCVGLPLAVKNINDDEAEQYHRHMSEVHGALKLTQNDELMALWWQALEEIVNQSQSSMHGRIMGLASRLLYQADKLTADVLKTILQKMLSPAVGVSISARFFEGFFSEATDQLLYDKPLLNTLETWILSLDESEFIEYLPLFRRVFSDLDSHERKRLLEMIFGSGVADDAFVYHEHLQTHWQRQLDELIKILA